MLKSWRMDTSGRGTTSVAVLGGSAVAISVLRGRYSKSFMHGKVIVQIPAEDSDVTEVRRCTGSLR